MGGKKKVSSSTVKDRRLDLFLQRINVETQQKKEMLENVENLTFEVINSREEPKLRLRKPE
jgi:hypothetical protein